MGAAAAGRGAWGVSMGRASDVACTKPSVVFGSLHPAPAAECVCREGE